MNVNKPKNKIDIVDFFKVNVKAPFSSSLKRFSL